MELLDCVGVPEYFTTHVGSIEDAGSGMIRIVRCIERNGLLIPICSLVTPALEVLQDGPRFREIAMRVAKKGAGAAVH